MSMKRFIPIFLLLALVIGVAACQSNTAEEAVDITLDSHTTETEQAADVDQHAPGDVDADETVKHEDAAPSNGAPSDVAESDEVVAQQAAAPGEAAIPEFVPPQPVTLPTGPEAVAFAMGDPDAPVHVIEFTDYQCPFCQRYATQTMPAVLENLVESGRVFYAIKDLPLDRIHPEARSASVAARCAGEQDAYLPMHDAVFAAQADWSGTGDGAEVVFTELAAELDLELDAFSTCLADGRQADNVQANVEEAMSLGLNGTPFFIIDGYPMSGAQPYEAFEMAVGLAENGELGDVITAYARQAYEAMVARQAPPAAQAPRAQQAPLPPAAPVEVALDNAYAIGDRDAPVTIVEYTDFQCPFCARHALQTFTQIEQDLVETGKVRYIFKDLPLTSIHPQATLAAEAARCAGAQDTGLDAYVAMHHTLFEEQQAWSGQANAADLFANYAAEIGLDGGSFATCLENHDYQDAVQADMQEAVALGINGTPAFLINGHLVSGALPFEVFEQAVESLIAEASVETASN
jgi:protein-disulfide isomerase